MTYQIGDRVIYWNWQFYGTYTVHKVRLGGFYEIINRDGVIRTVYDANLRPIGA